MKKEQAALLDTRDGVLKLVTKGTTELWRLKQRMECLLKGFENKICEACSEENKSRDKREEAAKSRARSEEVARRRPSSDRENPQRSTSSDRERAGRRPNKEATPAAAGCAGCWAPGCPTPASSTTGSSSASASGSSTAPATTGEKGKRPVVLTSRYGASISATVRARASSIEAPALQQYSNSRMTKLISTGGPMSLCYQLYTEGNVAAWKQAAVPNYGHSGVLLMPVKRMPHPDQVDPAAMAWQTAPASTRRVGTTEVVLRGVTREADGRKRELIHFTDIATNKQTVRFRFQTGGEELAARNEGLTLFSPGPGGAAGVGEQSVGAGPAKKAEKPKTPRREDKAE